MNNIKIEIHTNLSDVLRKNWISFQSDAIIGATYSYSRDAWSIFTSYHRKSRYSLYGFKGVNPAHRPDRRQVISKISQIGLKDIS